MQRKPVVSAVSDPNEDRATYEVTPRDGLTDGERATVQAALAILDRHLRSTPWTLNSPRAVSDFLRLNLQPLAHEVFGVLWLDAQHRLIEWEVLFRGTLTQTSVYPREVVKGALLHNAAAVILAHNHPSGMAEASRADELLTSALKAALDLVDVKVLDHIIIAGDLSLSFAETGRL